MESETTELNLQAEKTVRVYADISAQSEFKLRMRAMSHQALTGIRMTRKQYLEKLISDDVAKVKGASMREITVRKMSR